MADRPAGPAAAVVPAAVASSAAVVVVAALPAAASALTGHSISAIKCSNSKRGPLTFAKYGSGGGGGRRQVRRRRRWWWRKPRRRGYRDCGPAVHTMGIQPQRLPYGFILDKNNRVVQIEAIGLENPKVKTRRGIGFGATFKDIMERYQAPEAYQINGDTIVMQYLVRDKVAFRLIGLGWIKPHVVTAIVVAAGKT